MVANPKKSTTTTPRAPRILLAEDDKEMRKLLARAFRKEGYEVTECSHGINLVGHLSYLLHSEDSEPVDVVVSDIRMPGLSGIEVLESLCLYAEAPPVVLITAFGDDETHDYARRLGVAAMFDKPFSIDRLLAKIRTLVPSNADLEEMDSPGGALN